MTTIDQRSSGSGVLRAVPLIGIAAIAFGFVPNLSKFLLNEGSNPTTVMVLRSVVAMVIVGGYCLLKRLSLGLPPAMVALAGLLAVSSAFFNFAYVSATLYIDVGLATLIVFLHPFLVVLWYHVSGTTRLTVAQAAWSAIAFVGLAITLSVDFSKLSIVGLGFAAMACVLCAVMVLSLVRLNKQVGGLVTCFYAAAGGFLIFGASGLLHIGDGFAWPRTVPGWWAGLAVGIGFATIYFCWLGAVRLIGGSRATLLSFAEPVAAILVAWLMFGQVLTPLQLGGVSMVAVGLFLLEALPGRRVAQEAVPAAP